MSGTPDNAQDFESLIRRAVALRQAGDAAKALGFYREALRARPEDVEARYGLAQSLRSLGRPAESIAHYQACLASASERADVHISLGIAQRQTGQPDAAIESYLRAIALQPRLAAAHNNLGNVLAEIGRPQEALEAYEQASAIDPQYLEPLRGMGAVYHASGRREEALAALERARKAGDESYAVLVTTAIVLMELHRYETALPILRGVLGQNAGDANLHAHAGLALHNLGRLDEAVDAYEAALRVEPRSSAVYANFGNTLMRLSRLTEAGDAFHRALALNPNAAPAHTNLGNLQREQGFPSHAIASYEKAIAIDPSVHSRHSNLLLATNYLPDLRPEEIFNEHAQRATFFRCARSHELSQRSSARRAGDRLRVGYVSADFRNHAVAYFFEPVLESHDRQAFEITCYSNVEFADGVTERMRSLSAHWRDIRALDDAQAAQAVYDDGIDILVDLAGHTAGGRPGLMALKPAPVQASWLGYPNTTGLDAVDYYITDAHADPPGQVEHLYTETLVRLDAGLACYRPPREAPDVTPLPARGRGHITFASLNNPAKINPSVCALWCEVLARVPGSRLVLQARAFGEAGGREHVRELLRNGGVDQGRIEFLGRVRLQDYLALHGRIDLGLDTFPWNGHTTTCHSLWMGVPVIVPGWDIRHSSRLGLTALRQAGLPEFVADTAGRYVEIVSQLSADLDRLESLRARLRAHMKASPLTDAVAFTRCLEAAYRGMVERQGNERT